MTKDEFERLYAARSGISVERLHALGRHAAPCDCGDESCKGWQMLHTHTEELPIVSTTFVRGVSADDLQAMLDRLPRYQGFPIIPTAGQVIVQLLGPHDVTPLPEGEQ